jgi:hypothetical protein
MTEKKTRIKKGHLHHVLDREYLELLLRLQLINHFQFVQHDVFLEVLELVFSFLELF